MSDSKDPAKNESNEGSGVNMDGSDDSWEPAEIVSSSKKRRIFLSSGSFNDVEDVREETVSFIIKLLIPIGAALISIGVLAELLTQNYSMTPTLVITIGGACLTFPGLYALPRMIALRTSSQSQGGVIVREVSQTAPVHKNDSGKADASLNAGAVEVETRKEDELIYAPEFARNIFRYTKAGLIDDASKQKIIGKWLDSHVESMFVRDVAQKSIVRLTREIENLGDRTNVALTIGIFSTIAAGVSLFWFILQVLGKPFTDPVVWAMDFIPRIMVVLFIEVFAYFFLRIYRNGIYEIKYFQNEISNIEGKLLALEGAILSKDKSSIRDACQVLLKTERNFLLKKGDFTIEMAKGEIDQKGDLVPIELLERISKAVLPYRDVMRSRPKNNTADASGGNAPVPRPIFRRNEKPK
ncbi:hypothetical protein [Azospirillum argentinense]